MHMSIEEFLDYVKSAKSKSTYKEYKYRIKKFSEWFIKRPDEILEMRRQDLESEEMHQRKRFVREIEKFHAHLIQAGYSINSARTLTLGIPQLFRYYNMPIAIEAGSDVSKTVVSTKDFRLTIDHLRKMFEVADLRERVILSLGKDLALRTGDFVKLKKTKLPDLNAEAPVPFDLVAEKEDVLAKYHLSQESVDLLKVYLPTLKKDSSWLFPTNHKRHLNEDTLNKILRDLAERAKITIPENKRLRFHCLRKLFLSTCANMGIDVNIAKLMCGKSVRKDMLTYLSGVELTQAFSKVSSLLALRQVGPKNHERIDRLEEAIQQLQKENVGYRTRLEVITKKVTELEEQVKEATDEICELSGKYGPAAQLALKREATKRKAIEANTISKTWKKRKK